MQPYPLRNGAWERAEGRRRKIENIVGFLILFAMFIGLMLLAWLGVHIVMWINGVPQ